MAVLALAAGALLVAGCDNPGDPGGKRLDELSADPVFDAKPPGASSQEKAETPASLYKEGEHRDGPKVVVSFETPVGAEEVLLFYSGEADDAGWSPRSAREFGTLDAWTKEYPDGATAWLSLEQIGHSDEYRLVGEVGAADDG